MREAVSGQPSAISENDDRGSRKGLANRLRLVASLIVNLLALVLWLSLFAWLTGRILTDRFAWSQWLWWMPTPAALIAAMLGLLLAFRSARAPRRRRTRIMLWSAFGVALAIYFGTIEHRFLRRAPPIPTAQALTIAHWNMTLDNYADIGALLRGVAALDADITAITSPPTEVRRLLNEAAAASPADDPRFVLNLWPVFVLSRLPILRVRHLVGTDLMHVTLVELDAGARLGRPIALYLIDLPSSPRRSRMATIERVRRILDETDAPPPDLVVGDFNITRGSASIEALFPGMTDAFDSGGHGYGATFPGRLPLYHIDHVLVNERAGLRAARYDIIDEGPRRHRAQKAWIVAASLAVR